MSDTPADQIRRAHADGAVGIDHGWKIRLAKMMKNTPLSPSLLEAVQSLRHLLSDDDFEVLEAVIQGKCEEWTLALFRLPASYRLDFAVAIHVYTMEDPALYKIINNAMHNPSRRSAGSAGGVSSELNACMPFIKYLDTALELLPPEYIVTGIKVRRGVKWVYPSPENHDPEKHFKPSHRIMWYDFKSTSRVLEVMTRPQFCGVGAGPRSLFVILVDQAYDISDFSFFQGINSEHEVLFRPLSEFEIRESTQQIIDPFETSDLSRSGFPDTINLIQIPRSPAPPTPLLATTATACGHDRGAAAGIQSGGSQQ